MELNGLQWCFNRLPLRKVRKPDDPFIKVFKKRRPGAKQIKTKQNSHLSTAYFIAQERPKKTARGELFFSLSLSSHEERETALCPYRR